jgi:tetrahydromethanopterin S-methyltransferase subunit E
VKIAFFRSRVANDVSADPAVLRMLRYTMLTASTAVLVVIGLLRSMVKRLVAALVLGVLVAGCVHVGATITNAPTIPDCIPGSATKPCR